MSAVLSLVGKLNELATDPAYPHDEDAWLTVGDQSELPQLIQDILGFADEALITSGGKPNYAAFDVLKLHGYRVGPGEQDSFGWLTGVIYTPKGQIVFG